MDGSVQREPIINELIDILHSNPLWHVICINVAKGLSFKRYHMNIKEIKENLIAFKGRKFIYSISCNDNVDPVFFSKILSIEEIRLIDENAALLIAQD